MGRKSRLPYVVVTLCFALLVSSVAGILSGMFAFAAPALSLKWSATRAQTGAATNIGALAADLRPDIPGLEVVVTGIDGGIESGLTNGYVTCLNGQTGAVIWKVSLGSDAIRNHSPFEIADLDLDGTMEVVVAAWRRTVALNGEDGSVYWNVAAPSYDCWPAIADVNGDGYPEVFVSSGFAPDEGIDYVTALSYDGRILKQAPSWHPCYGGLAIGDANFDGKLELYQGDRSRSTSNPGAWGVSCLDPLTLERIWNRPDIFCSSHIPMLADVDKDGVLDVIVGNQDNNGIAVLSASDGSTIHMGVVGIAMHSQPTICDIDYDGNLEFISGTDGNYPKIWDLYDWKLDATLPVVCGDPPKVGDVNGDGILEIIANTDYYIRLYQVHADGSVVEVGVVGELDNPTSFTLLADVDADNFNELVVTSRSGYVYCFDALSAVSSPRPRCETPFYSSYRLGVAEYVSYAQIRPPLLFEDGYESGSFSAWSGISGSPVVQTAIKHDGNYAMRAAASQRYCYLTLSASKLNMRAYFYVDSSAGTAQLMRFRANYYSSYYTIATLSRTSTGALQLDYRSGSSTYSVTSSVTLSLDAWHSIEMRAVVASSGSYSVWLDGVEIGAFSLTGKDNNNYGNIDRVDVGCVSSSSSTVDIYVDCAARSNGYIGPEYSLSVTTSGSGSVTKNPDKTAYLNGDVVQLTAVPADGWSFSGWSGDLTGVTNPDSVTIDVDPSVTATFTQNEYSLTVTVAPLGAGTVSADIPGPYHYGDVVTLTAEANSGYTFSAWSGDASGSANPTAVTMDGNKAVTATFTGQQGPVVNYVDVWSFPDNVWVPQGGTVVQGRTVRLYAGVSSPVEPVSISYGLTGGSLTAVTAAFESTWNYYYVDWAVPYGAAVGVYDVKVESGATSTMASGRFQVGASAPVVNYVDVWSFPDNNWVSQGGVVTAGHTARIYAGISGPVAPVSISYRLQGGSWTAVTAAFESTWNYYYVDWAVPYGAAVGVYDVKVESGATSTMASGRFQVGASAPVVNYIDVWSFPDNNWVPQGGTVIQGHTARIYAGISGPVAPVSISYRLQGGSWTAVTAAFESTWNYYYIDWAVPYGAAVGVYDVQVESGVTSTMATGRFQVGASAPVVNYIDVWSFPDNNWVPQGGTVIQGHTARIYAGISGPVAPVSISYRLQGGSWTAVTASYESTWNYYYIDWAVPYGAAVGVYDVQVESGVTSTMATGRFQVGASAPVVNYVDVWSYPDNQYVAQGGIVIQGHTVRIYAGISGPVAPVSISYRLQGGSWTAVTASYESTWNYYYVDWAVPYGAAVGVYDVQVESGVTSTMASGRFQVGA